MSDEPTTPAPGLPDPREALLPCPMTADAPQPTPPTVTPMTREVLTPLQLADVVRRLHKASGELGFLDSQFRLVCLRAAAFIERALDDATTVTEPEPYRTLAELEAGRLEGAPGWSDHQLRLAATADLALSRPASPTSTGTGTGAEREVIDRNAQELMTDETMLAAGEKDADHSRRILDYSVALQQSIEYHARGKVIPPEIAALAPFHAAKLNNTLDAERVLDDATTDAKPSVSLDILAQVAAMKKDGDDERVRDIKSRLRVAGQLVGRRDGHDAILDRFRDDINWLIERRASPTSTPPLYADVGPSGQLAHTSLCECGAREAEHGQQITDGGWTGCVRTECYRFRPASRRCGEEGS